MAADLTEQSDEELLDSGREAIKREQWPQAAAFFAEFVRRVRARGGTVPASPLASYALCLGHGGDSRQALELCRRAVRADPRNPHVYWCLAQLHLLARSRKEAVETIERGLRAAHDNFLLLRLRRKLGVRQPTPLPFLDRKHSLNVRLGRLMRRLRGSAA